MQSGSDGASDATDESAAGGPSERTGTDAQLAAFYEQGYSLDAAASARNGRWRALGAVGKADHVVRLCELAGVHPASTLEVGCGDGALLCELHARGFGGRLSGVEIAPAAVAIARARSEIEDVQLYDGHRIPAADGSYELGIVAHVLEHVRDPPALLRETGRACQAVCVEVPLEANFSARRPGKRRGAGEVGHLQRLDRSAAHAIVAAAGLSIACELDDALPLAVHQFFAVTPSARLAATMKFGLRAGLHGLAPGLARRLFSVHYACLCVSEARG